MYVSNLLTVVCLFACIVLDGSLVNLSKSQAKNTSQVRPIRARVHVDYVDVRMGPPAPTNRTVGYTVATLLQSAESQGSLGLKSSVVRYRAGYRCRQLFPRTRR